MGACHCWRNLGGNSHQLLACTCWLVMYFNENHLETREDLIRYFTRYLGMELSKVNSAFRLIRIETPTLVTSDKGVSGLRPNTALGAYVASRELLNTNIGSKLKLPLVLWEHGKVFVTQKRQTKEFYVLCYNVLFSKTTGAKYMPGIVRCCETMLRKKCGRVFKADEDETGISIFNHDTDLELVHIKERADFWGGKNIEIAFQLDTCAKVSLLHEFGKIRRAPALDKK